jgi:hypothetical protein
VGLVHNYTLRLRFGFAKVVAVLDDVSFFTSQDKSLFLSTF